MWPKTRVTPASLLLASDFWQYYVRLTSSPDLEFPLCCPTYSCSGDEEEARPWLSWHLVRDYLCIFFLFVLVIKRPLLDHLDILPHLLLLGGHRGGETLIVLTSCLWSSLHIFLIRLGGQETCPWSSWHIATPTPAQETKRRCGTLILRASCT